MKKLENLEICMWAINYPDQLIQGCETFNEKSLDIKTYDCTLYINIDPYPDNKNIENYIEIFIKSPISKVKKFSNKKIYKQKYIQNVVGFDIKPEYPNNPHIIIKNDFSKPIKKLSEDLLLKIDKIIQFK